MDMNFFLQLPFLEKCEGKSHVDEQLRKWTNFEICELQ